LSCSVMRQRSPGKASSIPETAICGLRRIHVVRYPEVTRNISESMCGPALLGNG
jgi:hypothetical protein